MQLPQFNQVCAHVMHVLHEILLYTQTDDLDENIEENRKDELVRTRSQCFSTLLNFFSVYQLENESVDDEEVFCICKKAYDNE